MVYDTFDANEHWSPDFSPASRATTWWCPQRISEAPDPQNIFQKLDKSKLPNLANAWPKVTAKLAVYDPGNQYAANYMWGTTGIGYNIKTMKQLLGPDGKIDSWDVIFDPDKLAKFKDCGVQMLDSADDILPAALNYLGLDPNSTKPANLKRRLPLSARSGRSVRKFHSSEYLNGLATGEICLVVGWSAISSRHEAARPRPMASRLAMRSRKRARRCSSTISPFRRMPEHHRSPRADQLSLPSARCGEEFRFPVLCQRQSGQPETDRSENRQRQNDLSGPNHDEAAVRHHCTRSRDTTYDQSALNSRENWAVRRTTAVLGYTESIRTLASCAGIAVQERRRFRSPMSRASIFFED